MAINLFHNLVFLLLLSPSHALPNAKRADTSLLFPLPNAKPELFDIVTSGRYYILNCSTPQCSTLKRLLDTLWLALQPAIQDAAASYTHPSPAFTTFFNDPVSSPYVTALLTNISTSVSIYPPFTFPRGEHASGSPSLLCVNGPDQAISDDDRIGDYWDWCHLNPGTVMDFPGGKPYIVVCPNFFTIGLPESPPPNTCLSTNAITNRFKGNGAAVAHSQLWILLQSLAHYYIDKGRFKTSDFSDVNVCARLSKERSRGNGSNYFYYVASLFGHCTDFPDLANAGRELLQNSTGA